MSLSHKTHTPMIKCFIFETFVSVMICIYCVKLNQIVLNT